MFEEKYDFYSPSNINIHDLDQNMKDSLAIMGNLDFLTQVHCQNVANLSTRICQQMRCNNQFTIHCMIAGYIHDIGKCFIPEEIIYKDGALNAEEYEIMKTHTTLGYELCMKDINLRAYSDGPWYHHEALNGTGYPRGLKKNDIPYSAQIIRIADEYDALVTKRHYTTHINISATLRELIKGAEPSQNVVALDNLTQNERIGRISAKPLKALFKVVINDIYYEISCICNYVSYIESELRRLKNIEKYEKKMKNTKRPAQKDYYASGIKLLLKQGESIENYRTVLNEYKDALVIRKKRIDDLYKEIKIIKRLKIKV